MAQDALDRRHRPKERERNKDDAEEAKPPAAGGSGMVVDIAKVDRDRRAKEES